jgi:hypothetical protein
VTTPTADAFAALARSSPGRWSTLRFTVRRPGGRPGPVRAWIRRPDRLRVEGPDGSVLAVVREPPETARDAPFYENYFWIAMLDPVELADPRDPDPWEPDGPALEIDELTEVDHGGRPAWEAVVRPTPLYEPRCGCCSLLRTREVDLVEFADHPEHVLAAYPDAFRVRLDVGTGVCVRTEEIGGLDPGVRHDLRIEAVDEPMGEGLFPHRRTGLFGRSAQ